MITSRITEGENSNCLV